MTYIFFYRWHSAETGPEAMKVSEPRVIYIEILKLYYYIYTCTHTKFSSSGTLWFWEKENRSIFETTLEAPYILIPLRSAMISNQSSALTV